MEWGIFVFRRDLRLKDNLGLIASKNVVPIFILDPEQISVKNKYRSLRAIQFMVESIEDLSRQIKKKDGKLYVFQGSPKIILKKLCKKYKPNFVAANEDYTEYSKNRDEEIAAEINCPFNLYTDSLLVPLESVKNGQGNYYQKFTPFYDKAKIIKVPNPIPYSGKFILIPESISKLPQNNCVKIVKGGTDEGMKLLKAYDGINSLSKGVGKSVSINSPTSKGVGKDVGINLSTGRNVGINSSSNGVGINPSSKVVGILNASSHLSAYNKFGCVSIRQVYHEINSVDFRRNLYWRDYYYRPNKVNYKAKAMSETQKKKFVLWKKGETGCDIVDAAMIELNTTGYIQNRCRMLTASYLVKYLGIDWKYGEQYFATQLTDYDPSQNAGGWRWCASVGPDSQPSFQHFNFEIQAKKYDPSGNYRNYYLNNTGFFNKK